MALLSRGHTACGFMSLLFLMLLFGLGDGQAPGQFERFDEINSIDGASEPGDGGVELTILSRRSKRCYICSGQYPDRECELYPQYVTQGPGMFNCSRAFCTTYVRYSPKPYLLIPTQEGQLKGTSRPLVPEDFEVNSIARECEDLNRGNTCTVDHDGLGITCYTTCAKDLCNDALREPDQDDFLNTLRINPSTATVTPMVLTLDKDLNAIPVDGTTGLEPGKYPPGGTYNNTVKGTEMGGKTLRPNSGGKGGPDGMKEGEKNNKKETNKPQNKPPKRKGDRPTNTNSQTNSAIQPKVLKDLVGTSILFAVVRLLQ